MGKFSAIAQKRIRRTIQRFCDNSFNIKLVFSLIKIRSLFSVKDLIPKELKSCFGYRFRCAGCDACYVGETSRHICTRINEHLNMDKASHIFKHLQDSPRCRALCSSECFVVIDQATTRTQLKIKEAVHIHWEKLSLNQQLFHENLNLSL